MKLYLYRNDQMDQELRNKIRISAAERYGNTIPPDIAERIAIEEQHIIGSGYGTMLAAVGKLAEFSRKRGYPVGFRGTAGNLLVSHLLGIASINPMELGLRWEDCFGPSKRWMQPIALNVAWEILDDMRAYLAEILPECDLIQGLPDMPPQRIIIVPRMFGAYDPEDPERDYFTFNLCAHELIDLAGEVQQQTGSIPAARDIISDGSLILRAYHDNVSGIPVLGDLDGFQDFSRRLEPKTFADLTKILGLCLSPFIWFQAEHFANQPDPFDGLVGTREDVYDILVQHGIDPDDAFRIMQRVGRGGSSKLTPEHRDILTSHEFPDVFLETLNIVDYLYSRGQCADYLYWALMLLGSQ